MIKSPKVKTRYFPEGGRIETLDDLVTVICRYESSKGQPFALVYIDKRINPSINFSYTSPEARERHLSTWLETRRNTIADRRRWVEEYARQKFELVTSLQAGSIVYYTSGFEQTHATFYQVVGKVSLHALTVREIEATSHESSPGAMAGHAVPIADKFKGPTRKLSLAKTFPKLWVEGKKVHVSWYG